MKAFSGALTAVVAALFAVGADAHTPSSLTRSRMTEPTKLTLLDKATHTFQWDIFVFTYYDMDTGFEWLEIEHQLEAPIMASDEVAFELAFRSTKDPFINN